LRSCLQALRDRSGEAASTRATDGVWQRARRFLGGAASGDADDDEW